MNVKELKIALADVPDDVLVVLSRDAEGNGYSPLAEVDTNDLTRYLADSTYSGELIDGTDPDTPASDYPSAVRAVALWPTN